MTDVTEITRLSAIRPLSLEYAGGFWNSNDTLVMMLPRANGELTVAPVALPRHASDAEDVFPNDHLDMDGNVYIFGEKGVTVTVHPLGGDRHTDAFTVKLTEMQDGIFAVFCRDDGPLYDTYGEGAEAANRLFGLPEHEEPGLYVRKNAEVLSEEQVMEEVEYERYGETVTEERPTGEVIQEEGRRWFAVRVRLYASTDTEATAQDFIEDVADRLGAHTSGIPVLSYFEADPECTCEAGEDEEYARSGSTLVERHDKTATRRCDDCGGTFTTRNKRELADGMLGPHR